MATSSVTYVTAKEDSKSWYLEYVFETDDHKTYTWSYSRSNAYRTFVEEWPQHLTLFTCEDWWHEDKRSWVG